MFALDMDAGYFWRGPPGFGSTEGIRRTGRRRSLGLTGLTIYAGASTYNTTESFTGDFGATGVFQYSPPIGFTAGF